MTAAKDGRHAVRLAHHEEGLRGEADVLHGQGHQAVAVEGAAPACAVELAVVEVADGVGGEEPVTLQERAQQDPIADLPDLQVLAELARATRGRGHQIGILWRRPAARRRRRERRLEDALIGDVGRDQLGRRHVASGTRMSMPSAAGSPGMASCSRPRMMTVRASPVSLALADDVAWRADVDGHARVAPAKAASGIGAGHIGHVAVGGDPVRADEHRVDRPATEEPADGTIGDDRGRHVRCRELGGADARAGPSGSRLQDPGMDGPARPRRRPR